ncbi:type II secretion system protein E [Pollutimonas nitritireducens]|uniref:Type II secretion system protein E n=1 Tax=Pollutimonas nitritireducens TaxID=2045209 RepID=A0A2N4ULA5_9BURK|nr:glycosyl transferase family protein [Pollutimonas nitritireducens]PLC55778.1 type II secretion system protein E [Pollutimonas nitritireducens]
MSNLSWPYFFADYYRSLEFLAAIVGVFIFVSTADDLFIDTWFWLRRLRRYFTIRPHHPRLTELQLREKDEQHLAIMIPAWLEFDVIAPMLENMVATLEYKNYMLFAGTYCNDARTIAEVERMRRRYRHLIRVEVPHAGPTNKADCLNWIVQAAFLEEKKRGIKFAGMVLHDSEDVVHPLELKYFNYLLPRIDFVQLPVTSLERGWHEFVAGTYMDEFAEWHTKDLVVRESLTGMVPSAGVGTCFSKRALADLAAETNNQPFNTATLTEDYDIGTRLARRNMKQIFGKFPVQYIAQRHAFFGLGGLKVHSMTLPMSVREYFPDKFRAAYRQKARWTLGISLQGWTQVGWEGSLANRYLLLRDRKGLVTSFIAIAAYFLLLNFLLFVAADHLGLWTVYYPSLFAPDSWLIPLMAANSAALLLRAVQRFYFVSSMYGWEHGLLSIPRMVLGNAINAMAAGRAWRQFIVHLFTGKPLVWDKTMHDFPSDEQLVRKRERLGDLLLSWQAINEADLERALKIQQQTGMVLGQVLVREKMIEPSIVDEALSFQMDQEGLLRPSHTESSLSTGAL